MRQQRRTITSGRWLAFALVCLCALFVTLACNLTPRPHPIDGPNSYGNVTGTPQNAGEVPGTGPVGTTDNNTTVPSDPSASMDIVAPGDAYQPEPDLEPDDANSEWDGDEPDADWPDDEDPDDAVTNDLN